MALLLLGPKRLYVMGLFWERVDDPHGALQRVLSVLDRTWGAERSGSDVDSPTSACRLVRAVRWHRVLWARLIGLSLLIFEAQP
jgi:hypothetical protein